MTILSLSAILSAMKFLLYTGLGSHSTRAGKCRSKSAFLSIQMKQLLISACVAIAVTSAHARLGKTVEECDKLYGTPPVKSQRLEKGILIKNYANERTAFSCRFNNNMCFEIGVSRLDENGDIKSLSPEEVVALTRTNLGSIPRVDKEEHYVGPNTVEHRFGTDGRYVLREETTKTGVITILRDNNLAPLPATHTTDPTRGAYVSPDELKTLLAEDARELESFMKTGLEKPSEFIKQKYLTHGKLWREAAERGLPDAEYFYGECFNWGIGVEANKPEAISWLTRAADHGHARAQFTLGVVTILIKPSPEGAEELVKWWSKASKQGLADAQMALGSMFLDAKKDVNMAFGLVKLAAEQGNVKAQVRLSECYLTGEGCVIDTTEAIHWLQLASDAKYSGAQYCLGLFYTRGVNVPRNYTRAFQLYRAAAEQGDLDAQLAVIRCYTIGEGVDQSFENTIPWLLKASKQGNSNAQCLLGTYYFEGKYVDKNATEAFRWFRKAADQGVARAQVLLGMIYHYGYGVSQDKTAAANWYLKAADQGNEEAKKALITLRAEP